MEMRQDHSLGGVDEMKHWLDLEFWTKNAVKTEHNLF